MRRWNPDKPLPLTAIGEKRLGRWIEGGQGRFARPTRAERATLKRTHCRKSRRERGRILATTTADYFGTIDKG